MTRLLTIRNHWSPLAELQTTSQVATGMVSTECQAGCAETVNASCQADIAAFVSYLSSKYLCEPTEQQNSKSYAGE